jgi:hypothetical protein
MSVSFPTGVRPVIGIEPELDAPEAGNALTPTSNTVTANSVKGEKAESSASEHGDASPAKPAEQPATTAVPQPVPMKLGTPVIGPKPIEDIIADLKREVQSLEATGQAQKTKRPFISIWWPPELQLKALEEWQRQVSSSYTSL